MTAILLKFFGGMIPRLGEQHLSKQKKIAETGLFGGRGEKPNELLSDPSATDAQNANLYSGELRPLAKPARSHGFARPGDPDFNEPLIGDPSWPPDLPPPPPVCIPVVIETDPVNQAGVPGDNVAFTVLVNADVTVPVRYQWFQDNIIMSGEISPVLNVLVTDNNINSRYNVAVYNPCGDDISLTARVV